MVYHQNSPHPTADISRLSASEAVATFLAAWDAAATSYERLLDSGLARNDLELSKDRNYARLLKSGQCILWIGGHRATAHAARLIVRQVPKGSVDHFERLWGGLLRQEEH